MNLKSLKDIPTSFALAKKAMIACLAISCITIIVSFAWSFYIVKNFTEIAYIITEHGQVTLARNLNTSDLKMYRKPEVRNHIIMFHDLFWTIDQFNMNSRTEQSLHLIGNSGKQLYLTLKARGHYNAIKNQNLKQRVTMDSIRINMNSKPFRGAFFGKLHVRRTDQNKSRTENLRAKFIIQEVTRTNMNPHGLLIEKYDLTTSPIKN